MGDPIIHIDNLFQLTCHKVVLI